jgi:phosphatidylglycerol---prolipoprotein diacylglyceryl transferase
VHPILLRIGSFQLPTYGVLLATALVVALWVVVRLGRREGLDTGLLFDFSTWIIIAALVGAKILMVITEWSFYWNHPGEILSWSMVQAGGVFYGGFIAAVLFSWWYVRRHRLPLWKVFDVYAPAIAVGQAIGRWGCFMAGDDYGKPTHFFIHVTFTNPLAHQIGGVPLNTPVHPAQLYESAATFLIFVYLWHHFRRKQYEGQIFVQYVLLYAVARFFIEFLRGDPDRGFVFHHLLSTSQFIAILAAATAAGLAVYLRKRPQEALRAGAARQGTKA